MTHQNWLRLSIAYLEEAGLRHVAGIPLLAFSQYDTAIVTGAYGSTRILQVSVVTDSKRLHVQLWWTPNETVDVHVTELGAATKQWMIVDLDADTAHAALWQLAASGSVPAPTEYAH